MKQWTPEEVKKLRETYKLSQKKLGDLTGVTDRYIYYLEKGKRKPSKSFRLLLDCIEEKLKKRKGGNHEQREGTV